MEFSANQETLAVVGRLYLSQVASQAEAKKLREANAALVAEIRRLNGIEEPADAEAIEN